MVSDSIKFLHSQFSTVMLALIIIIAFLGLIILMRRFRREQHASKARQAGETGASEGTLKALLQEIQSMPQGSAPAKPVKLEQLTEKDRARLEREVQQRMSAAGDPKTDEGAEVLQQLRDKESELQRLQAKLKELQNRIDEAPEEDAGGNFAEIESLQVKIQDLEARLKEYEIIEDDIADLSTYKEENARLRELLEEQGAEIPEMDAPAPEEPAAATAGTPAEASVAEASESPTPIDVESSSPQDESAAESAEESTSEPAVHVDADQLLSEVDELLTLAEQEGGDSSALEEDLNTDKLLQEAKSMPGDQAGE